MNQLYSFVVRDKPSLILLALYNSNVELCGLDLCKVVDTTYAHAWLILNAFEDAGLVYFEKVGRSKFIHLTKKGEVVASSFNLIRATL